jgi:hypothetical protein
MRLTRALLPAVLLLSMSPAAFSQTLDAGRVFFPLRSLWSLPIANQREPRFSLRLTSLHGAETSIGGVFPLVRFYGPSDGREGLQLDLEAAVFTRLAGKLKLTVADYALSLPFSWSRGPWQARFGYHHVSGHLGDEYIKDTGVETRSVARGEVVAGLARRWAGYRLYGEAGVAYAMRGIPSDEKERLDFGGEWLPQNSPLFGALDLELRADHDWEPDVTLQMGREWRAASGRRARVGIEGYHGRSPYLQFRGVDEHWGGISIGLDW